MIMNVVCSVDIHYYKNVHTFQGFFGPFSEVVSLALKKRNLGFQDFKNIFVLLVLTVKHDIYHHFSVKKLTICTL